MAITIFNFKKINHDLYLHQLGKKQGPQNYPCQGDFHATVTIVCGYFVSPITPSPHICLF